MAYLTQVDTSTLSNQNITTALLAHTYTNTTRVRKVFVGVDLAQIAGNGDYVAYVTIQRAGAGNAYRAVPITTAAVASGITIATLMSAPIILNATDVLKVYVTGLAGDTTTPDTIVYIWEEWVSTDSSGRVELAATGLDAITATRPSGVATTFPQMVVQLFYRFFGKSTLTATQLKTYAANGSTVVTTQTVSDDATTQTQGESSR